MAKWLTNLKNKEVGGLGEFDVKYFSDYNQTTSSTPGTSLDRGTRNSVNIGDHPAGFKILNDQGSYYVYGLPAYNNTDISNLFSVKMPNKILVITPINMKKLL